MHVILTEDKHAQLCVAHQMLQIVEPWMVRRWLELKITNGKLLIQIPLEKAHRIDLLCSVSNWSR